MPLSMCDAGTGVASWRHHEIVRGIFVALGLSCGRICLTSKLEEAALPKGMREMAGVSMRGFAEWSECRSRQLKCVL
jgi:hypothetical protein